jgi:hypothetical protein
MSRVWITVPLLAAAALGQDPPAAPGYTDTPFLPDSEWRVHDAARPRPPVVAPAPAGAPVAPPQDAIVLFDGKDLAGWIGRGGKAGWKLEDGAAVVDGSGDIVTREVFGDVQLHLEWAAPADAKGASQDRGNSGLFLMGRYEIQILDSHENPTYADGQAAALYGQQPPLVNACRRPGEWQTYDVIFRAPRFEDGKLKRPACVTLLHNGVLVHDHVPLLGATAHRAVPKYEPHPATGPIRLQDHGAPVRFRNIWLRRLDVVEPGGGATAEDALRALMDALQKRDRAGATRELTAAGRRRLRAGELGFASAVLEHGSAVDRWVASSIQAQAESAEAQVEAVLRDGTSKSAYAVVVMLVKRDGRWFVDSVH